MFQTLYIHVKRVESKLCIDVICEMTYPFWEAVIISSQWFPLNFRLCEIFERVKMMFFTLCKLWKVFTYKFCLNNISEKIYPTATVLLIFNSPVLLLQLMNRQFVALLMLCTIKCTSFSVFVLAIVLQFLNEVFVASTKREAIVAKIFNQQQISTIMLCC